MATFNYRFLVLSIPTALILGNMYFWPVMAQEIHHQPVSSSPRLQAQFTQPVDSRPASGINRTSTGTRLFIPPKDSRPASGPRTSTGTRRGGCLGPTATAFTAFGPPTTETILGQTVAQHPTFVWHLPETDATLPIVFRLLAPDEDNIPVPIYETTLDYTSGFSTHQLPTTMAALSTGVEYRWQVIIECNPEFPAQAMLQELSFEVVSTSPELAQSLTAATTVTEQAVAYGQAGIWYDAIAQVAQTNTPADRQTLNQLLIDLADSMPETEEQLRQDILTIVETTP